MWRGRAGRLVGIGVVGVLVVGCGGPPDQAPPGIETPAAVEAAGGWERLPQAPLSARHGAVAVRLDDALVVLGGRDTPACPPGAGCVAPAAPGLSDGARFDPSTRRWTRIADAPAAVVEADTAVLTGSMYLWLPGEAGPAFLAYHADTDRWERLPVPPAAPMYLDLATAGDHLVGYAGSHEGGQRADLLFDPAQRRWSELPVDPLAPSFDRSMVWAGGQLVLLALDLVESPGSAEPSLYRAAALDLESNTWRRLPDSEIAGGYGPWSAVGSRVINPSVGTSDGGEVNDWGREYPHGGVLDLATGRWSALPPAVGEPEPSRYASMPAAGDAALLVGQGWALDPAAGRWEPLAPPEGAGEEGQAAAVGDGRYHLWGGVRWSADGELTDQGWTWTPRPGGRGGVRGAGGTRCSTSGSTSRASPRSRRF
jgi:hypothetical protein